MPLGEPRSAAHRTLCQILRGLRLTQWQELAARVAVDEALTVILSWYEYLDLDLFQTFRTNGKYVSEPAWIDKRKKLGYSFIEFADIHKFVDGLSFAGAEADVEEAGEEEGEEAEGEEGTEETRVDEETEEAAQPKASDVVPPSSSEAPSSAKTFELDLGKVPATDDSGAA